MSSASKDPANETPLAWRLQSDDGLHLRADATDAGRLVLLSDALRWLMEVRELPRSEAVETLCSALESAQPAPEIFRARQSDRAQPITGDEALFGYHTEETWACMELGRALVERRRRDPFRFDERSGSFGSNGELTAAGWAAVKEQYRQGERPAVLHVGERAPHLCEPGVPAAVRYIREHWGAAPKPSVAPQRWQGRAYGLAVRLSDALALLGCDAKHGSAGVKVEPPPGSGWTVHSAYGALRTVKGELLIRLQDVHAWLMQRDGLPSAAAAARIFGAFMSDASSQMGLERDAGEVRKHLYITELTEYAEAFVGFAGRQFVREVSKAVPCVPHHRFAGGSPAALMYSLGLMAGEVWAPHAGDIDVDERLQGYCADGPFPSVDKCRQIVGRLAVPFAAAHKLWGWGCIASEPQAASVVPQPAQIGEADVIDMQTLAQYRGQFSALPAQQRPQWPAAHVGIARAAVDALGRGGVKQIAKQLGISGQGLADVFKRHPAPKASPFPTVRRS